MDDMEEWSNNTRHSEEYRAGANAAFERVNKYYSRTQGAHLVATKLENPLTRYPFEIGVFLRKGFC
jgi:hypothetical protein